MIFQCYNKKNRGQPLVYLDSAASAQKPHCVIDAISQFYTQQYANIHRGIYELSETASARYEAVRTTVKEFIHAACDQEIIFTHGTTESINLVAQSLGRTFWQAGDEVIISGAEHHSNIVPWQLLREQIGIVIKVIPVTQEGTLDYSAYQQLFSERTKLVAVSHVSNVLGSIFPIKQMIAYAHRFGALVLVDGAQAVAHFSVDVTDLDCDFYTFSAHKLYGPTGIGILYGKRALLEMMPPYQGGGSMIETVTFDHVTFAKSPTKFEAGTPDIAGVIGLKAAIDYVQGIGLNAIFAHQQLLLEYALSALRAIEGLRIFGSSQPKIGVISFVLDGVHAHDVGTVLDHEGIAIRAGHHCAMPLMERYQVPAMVRASFGIYNQLADIDKLVTALLLTKRIFT